ncbi:MAG TPA: TlyA family RNA methyltransferase [Verrucomicrobiae bacterium]|nr:TlyA family RNA methyltransferase [Verrucomicrobiae bacterium]
MTRLDQALVERGLCESRERAKRAILAGQVRVNSQTARKASDSVKVEDEISLDAPEKYVSRGGHKLEHALKHFQLDVAGAIAIDLGASTGGFTDCLLQNGVAKVFAVDVGQGQLAWKLRKDKRVAVMEKTNARHLKLEQMPKSFSPADIAVVDCSFISLRKILPPAIALLKSNGKIVALVKPQFEAGKAEVDKGRGVITDSAVHDRVIEELKEFVSGLGRAGSPLPADGAHGVTRATSLVWRGVTESPLLGPAGNKEFLVLIEKTS